MKINYDEIDEEIRDFCRAINSISDDIYTIESCCGHGKELVHIWFECTDLNELPKLLYWLDGCHTGYYGWRVEVTTDCAMSFPKFCIKSLIKGEDAYEEAKEIAFYMSKQSNE